MSSTFSTVRVTDAVEATLNAGFAAQAAAAGRQPDPVGIVNAPPNVTDGSGRPTKLYYVVFPIPTASGEASFSDFYETVDLEYQIRSVGMTRKQAEWGDEQARIVMCGRNTSGAYTFPMTPQGSGYIVNRRVALFGAVTSDAPGTFEVNSSFYVTCPDRLLNARTPAMPPQSAKNKVPPAEEWISVKHPKLDDPDEFPRVTREAFEASFKDLGWVEIKGTESTSAAPLDAQAAVANAGGN
jgi:hypothetical protein